VRINQKRQKTKGERQKSGVVVWFSYRLFLIFIDIKIIDLSGSLKNQNFQKAEKIGLKTFLVI